jgi:hypothetical protein
MRRLEPSGSVTEISDIWKNNRKASMPFDPSTRPLHGLARGGLAKEAHGLAMSEAARRAAESSGRHERTRTADLLRVKQAL